MTYYDDLARRDPEERERVLMAALPAQVAHAQDQASGFAKILAKIPATEITSRDA